MTAPNLPDLLSEFSRIVDEFAPTLYGHSGQSEDVALAQDEIPRCLLKANQPCHCAAFRWPHPQGICDGHGSEKEPKL